MTSAPPSTSDRWPEGWRPVKRSHGSWVIYDHQLLYAMRSWNAFCWTEPRNRRHIAGSGSKSKQHAIDALVEHMASCQPWKPWEQFINNTGGNQVKDLLPCSSGPRENLPLFTIESCVASQVGLLRDLYRAGLLKVPPPPRPERNS